MITAKIICDSVSPNGTRLTTIELNMHRFILAEFNTHRVFSRNSASSRAIPIEKRIKQVLEDPALPIEWGKNQKGMQAQEFLSERDRDIAHRSWLCASINAIRVVEHLSAIGLHKQVANRLLEPFLWHKVIVTSTEWENFFEQRCSPFAQPEMRILAEAMRFEYYTNNYPILAPYGSWHMPYINSDDIDNYGINECKKASVARCARVSYMTQDNEVNINKDIELYNRLHTSGHMSPFEHVATPEAAGWDVKGNFKGWKQLRHEVFGK